MKGAMLGNMSFLTRKFLHSSTKSNVFNSVPKQPSLAALTRSQLRVYSTKEDDDDDDVSTEELKRRIQKYFDGNEEAIPSIFEGILKRKLSGKHEESDDELMKEIRGRQPLDDVKEQESGSDSSGESETDED